MASCYQIICIGWRALMRVIGFLIGLVIFVILIITLVCLIEQKTMNFRVIFIFIMCVLANVTWIWGIKWYKPRLIFLSLVWYTFVAGYTSVVSDFSTWILMYLVFYILAMCCYDSVWREASKIHTDQTRKNHSDPNETTQVVVYTRDNIATATVPYESLNSTCNVTTTNTKDPRTPATMIG